MALLDVRGDGVSEVVLARFAEAIEDGMASADGLVQASRVRMVEMLAASTWSPACVVGACLKEVHEQTGADFVVTAGLSGSGQSYHYTINLLDAVTGQLIGQVDEGCPACTVEDVAASATMAAIGLVNEAGTAQLPDGVAGAPDRVAALERRVKGHARSLRRAAVLVVGLAVLSAGAGLYFLEKDGTGSNAGHPLLGAAGGLALSGATMFGLSLRF